jgi:predicted permease
MASVALSWLVVCANLSSLLLARSSRRSTELAVRRAVGAGRARLVRQLMVESASLALPGGALGILLAFWALPVAVRAAPASFLPADVVWIDATVVGVAVAVVAASAVTFGLLPALRAALPTPHAALQPSERVAPHTGGALRVLLAAEVAVGLIVVVGAVLLTKSVRQIERVDLGFDASGVLGLRVGLPASSSDEARYLPAQRELLRRIAALPGVETATIGGILWPNLTPRSSIWLEDGRGYLNGEATDQAFAPSVAFIGPNYFALHGVRVLRGREMGVRDDFSGPRVAVVNEAMAAVLWPGEDAIGKRVNFGGRSTPTRPWREPWHEIVGVVPDIRHAGVDLPARPTAYRAALQYPLSSFDLVVRAAVPPATLWPLLRDAVRGVDPRILIYEQLVLADVVSDAHAAVTYSARALSLFASMTALLAAFGVYSVLAYAVAQRRRELGIRIALGAAPARLARDVARQVVWVLIPGLTIGLVAAAWSAQLLGGLLYEVTPTDAGVFAGAAAALALIACVAAALPARAAARIDPVEALRA